MNENEFETLDSTNEEQDVEETFEEEIELEEEDESQEDELETLRKKNIELLAQKKHWQEKAGKKAEAKPDATPVGDLSTKDLYALMEAKVAQEDIGEVEDYAKMKNIPIAEALKTSFVKSLLKDKTDERKTASATYTGAAKRSNKELPEDVLLTKASKGELPDNDEDLARLIRARKGIK